MSKGPRVVGPRRGRVELSYVPFIYCVTLVNEGGVRKASLSNVNKVDTMGITSFWSQCVYKERIERIECHPPLHLLS